MSYDKNGLGFAEINLCALYFPTVFETLAEAFETDPLEALMIVRKTIDEYNLGLIEKEN